MEMLEKLGKSKFRSSFHLNKQMKEYVLKKGINTIEKHAYDFIDERLRPAYPKGDGKQTPYKGHPVFIAQHATATCCRGCLYKWHHILKGVELTDSEINYIVGLIIKWIKKEMN